MTVACHGPLRPPAGPDPPLKCRLELFLLIVGSPLDGPYPRFPEHISCEALAPSFRGKLCQQLAQLPARRLAAGQNLYRMGNPAGSSLPGSERADQDQQHLSGRRRAHPQAIQTRRSRW